MSGLFLLAPRAVSDAASARQCGRAGHAALIVCLLWHPAAATGQTALRLDEVLTRAREMAPAIVSARLAVAESRARLAGASLRLQANPEVDAVVGNRDGGSRSTDLQFGATQMFEPPGRRAARIAVASAQVDQSATAVDLTTLGVLQEASTLFQQAVYSSERVRYLAASTEIADQILAVADRRYRAGDLAVLDVNLARAARARAVSAQADGAADQTEVLGALRALLRLPEPIAVEGRLTVAALPDAAALQSAIDERPDLRGLEAAIREADADITLATSLGKPNYGASARYQREGGDHIVYGGFTIVLPLFSKGQELRAAGTARGARLRSELDAARTRLRIQLQSALAAYEERVAAAQALERDALPSLDESDALTTRSFEAGQIGLPDVLMIRRELLDTRFQYLSALLEAALARVTIEAAAGVLR